LEDIETYNRTKTDYRQAQVDIDQLQKRIADYQEDQKRPENWDMEALLLGAEAVLHLHRMASRGEKARQEEWQELYLLLSEKDARIVKFLSQHHELKAQEQYICMLIRMRFLPSEIAVLLDVSSQTVTNLRIRMMRKLFEVKGGAKEFDVQIRTI
jgi:DNA-binding CsgD family transcriptional regulator